MLSGELENIEDYWWHDGPLLSRFYDPRDGSHWLRYWCDCSKEEDRAGWCWMRWAWLQVRLESLLAFEGGLLALDEIIPNRCLRLFLEHSGGSKRYVQEWSALCWPGIYTPGPKAFIY